MKQFYFTIMGCLFCFMLALAWCDNAFSIDKLKNTDAVNPVQSEQNEKENPEKAPFLEKPKQDAPVDLTQTSGSPWLWFLQSFFILLFLFVVLFFVLKWIQGKKKTPLDLSSSNTGQIIRSLTKVSLGNQHYLEVVQILNKVYILGISPNQISLIRLLEEEEELNQLENLLKEEQKEFSKLKQFSFKQFLASQIDRIGNSFLLSKK